MSIEQMSGMPPQQPEEEPKKSENEKPAEGGEQKPEKEITSPEESVEITRKRRLEFGLEADAKELSPEEIKVLRQKIDDNLGILYSYNPESFSSEIQEQIYFVGMEAEAGKDIELAARQLELFLVTLWRSKEFKNLGVVPESEGKKERVLSREEILSQLGNRCEISKIEQELADEEGIYLLEVINKENTKR